mgnify:CR=1 FL=1
MKPNAMKMKSLKELSELMDGQITKGLKPKGAVAVEKVTVSEPKDGEGDEMLEGAPGMEAPPASPEEAFEEKPEGGARSVEVTDEEISALESLLQKAT